MSQQNNNDELFNNIFKKINAADVTSEINKYYNLYNTIENLNQIKNNFGDYVVIDGVKASPDVNKFNGKIFDRDILKKIKLIESNNKYLDYKYLNIGLYPTGTVDKWIKILQNPDPTTINNNLKYFESIDLTPTYNKLKSKYTKDKFENLSGKQLEIQAKKCIQDILEYIHTVFTQLIRNINNNDETYKKYRINIIFGLYATERYFMLSLNKKYNIKNIPIGSYGIRKKDGKVEPDLQVGNYAGLQYDIIQSDGINNVINIIGGNIKNINADIGDKTPTTTQDLLDLSIGFIEKSNVEEYKNKIKNNYDAMYKKIINIVNNFNKLEPGQFELYKHNIDTFINNNLVKPGSEIIFVSYYRDYVNKYIDLYTNFNKLKKNNVNTSNRGIKDYTTKFNTTAISIYILTNYIEIYYNQLMKNITDQTLKTRITTGIMPIRQNYIQQKSILMKSTQRTTPITPTTGTPTTGEPTVSTNQTQPDMPGLTEKDKKVSQFLWNYYMSKKANEKQKLFIIKYFEKYGIKLPSEDQETFEKILETSKLTSSKCKYDNQYSDALVYTPDGVRPEDYHKQVIDKLFTMMTTAQLKFYIPTLTAASGFADKFEFKFARLSQLTGYDYSIRIINLNSLYERIKENESKNNKNNKTNPKILDSDKIFLISYLSMDMSKTRKFYEDMKNSRILMANSCDDLGPDTWRAIDYDEFRRQIEIGNFYTYLYSLLANPYTYTKSFNKNFDPASKSVIEKICGSSDPITCPALETRSNIIGRVLNDESLF